MEPYHEEYSSNKWSTWQHHIPQHILFRKLWVIIVKPWPCWQQDSLLLTGRGIYPQFIIELHVHVLQCFLWGGLIKNKGGAGLFRISQKEKLFHILYQPSDSLVMRSPFLHPSKNGLSFPFTLGRERTYLGVYWFISKIARVLPVLTGRVRIGCWTLL